MPLSRGSMTIAVAPLGFHSCADLGEHLLGLVLDVGVERQAQVLAGLGRLDLGQLDRLAEGVLLEPALAVDAAEHLVLRVLQPRQALVVGADGAQQLRGHPLARVLAAELGDELEPLDLERLDLAAARGGHVAGDVDEAGVAARELAQDLVLGLAEQPGDLRGDLRGVLDEVRRGGDRHRRLGDGELGARAIGDRAAARGHDQVGLLLGGRGLLERARLDDAEPGGAGRADDEQGQEDREEQPDPALDQLHLSRPGPSWRRWFRCRSRPAGAARASRSGRARARSSARARRWPSGSARRPGPRRSPARPA